MRETRFVLIRHAESVWNAAGRWQGHADPPLSERGRAQAEALAADLAPLGIEVLLASDLARAAQTASIVGEAIGCEPVFDARLRELNIGRWAGLTREEIARRDADALARFEAGDLDARAGGAESRRELRARTRAAVQLRGQQHAGRLVALVVHLGVIGSLRPGLLLANAAWHLLDAGELAAPAPDATRAACG